MSNDFLSLTIKSLLENGINLHLETEEEEEFYLLKLAEHLKQSDKYNVYLKSSRYIEIENEDFQIAMDVFVTESTLFMFPYVEDIYEVFAEILKFISENHEKILLELRGSGLSRIESPEEIKSNLFIEDTEEFEEPSSDDLEWI